jgi:hypothetical protein
MDEFKVGDKVWDMTYGWGEIYNIIGGGFPIHVNFDSIYISYTLNGECYAGKNRTLFFEEIKIPESAYKRPRWRAEKQDSYCFIAGTGLVTMQKDFGSFENDKHFKHGNYFKTEEEAKESKFYKLFHE